MKCRRPYGDALWRERVNPEWIAPLSVQAESPARDVEKVLHRKTFRTQSSQIACWNTGTRLNPGPRMRKPQLNGRSGAEGGSAVMGRVDLEYIPVLEQDWRYARLLHLTRQLLCERKGQETARISRCPHCQDGKATVDGHSVDCGACAGAGGRARAARGQRRGRDDGHHGEAAGGRWPRCLWSPPPYVWCSRPRTAAPRSRGGHRRSGACAQPTSGRQGGRAPLRSPCNACALGPAQAA